MNNICLISSTFEIISIIKNTRAKGWKDIKKGDVIYFEYDPCVENNIYVCNKFTGDCFLVNNRNFNYYINKFKLKEVIC